jgi:Putative transposase
MPRARGLQSSFKANHAEIFAQIEAAAWEKHWVAQCKAAGRGRTALRYLAAYVRKSAFSQERIEGHDKDGHLIMRYRDSADNTIKHEALYGVELIRRWLLHVLPKGLVRVRHYGWLSPAAHKAFLRVRFLLGLEPYRIPPALKSEPPRCPFCNGPARPNCKNRAPTRPATVPGDPQGRRMKPIPRTKTLCSRLPHAKYTLCIQISRIITNYGSRVVPVAQRPFHTAIVCELGFPPPPRRTTEAPASLPTALVPPSLVRQAA